MKDRAIILLVLSNLLLSAGLGYALFFREPVNAQAQGQRKWSKITAFRAFDGDFIDKRNAQAMKDGYEPFAVTHGTVSPFVWYRK